MNLDCTCLFILLAGSKQVNLLKTCEIISYINYEIVYSKLIGWKGFNLNLEDIFLRKLYSFELDVSKNVLNVANCV